MSITASISTAVAQSGRMVDLGWVGKKWVSALVLFYPGRKTVKRCSSDTSGNSNYKYLIIRERLFKGQFSLIGVGVRVLGTVFTK